uniref:KIB1-4 beta-propeller domain-containing protein n=1 Tax=Tanacetum cinerariifolium TaxID=118510 RepID=A0A6L2LSW4_TANCI|nr:hypothetical protein [Tanacetum cinerariifolium]
MGKIVFLDQSSLVVVVWGSKIGFCLVGDNKRTTFDYENLDSKIMDITYYNGRVYAFDCAHRIRALDVYGEDPKSKRLDGGKGKNLLLVIRQGVVDNDDYKTNCFQVWTYDLGNGRDLGTKSLFVGGSSSSFWVEQDYTGAIKGNCIYFTRDGIPFHENGGGMDMRIYHLSDGTIEPLSTGESSSYLTPPFWLQSSIESFEAAASLNDDSSNADELSDMCFEEDLTHEFMEMMKRDISRRSEEEVG